MTLELEIFRFDAKSDYLPYYKKSFIKIEKQKTLLDIFNQINNEEPFDYEKEENFAIVINKKYVKLGITIEELIKDFGKHLIIEPISIRRANKDFIIDHSDFIEKINILKDFITEEDKQDYLNNKILFYASNTLNYYYEYIGDPIILLAHKLIERDPSKKEKILKALINNEYSIEYHTSLINRVYKFDKTLEDKITQVKNELGYINPIEKQNFCIDSKSKVQFQDYDLNNKIIHDFKDFNLAYYSGCEKDNETEEFLKKLNAKLIKLENKNTDLNLQTFHINQNLTIKLAATIMLEAYDSAADLLIVHSKEVFKLFDTNRKSLTKVMGREVIIPVLHKSELFNLAFNKHDIIIDQLKKHKIDPKIL